MFNKAEAWLAGLEPCLLQPFPPWCHQTALAAPSMHLDISGTWYFLESYYFLQYSSSWQSGYPTFPMAAPHSGWDTDPWEERLRIACRAPPQLRGTSIPLPRNASAPQSCTADRPWQSPACWGPELLLIPLTQGSFFLQFSLCLSVCHCLILAGSRLQALWQRHPLFTSLVSSARTESSMSMTKIMSTALFN